MAVAQASPFLVTLRVTPDRMPPILTIGLPSRPRSPTSWTGGRAPPSSSSPSSLVAISSATEMSVPPAITCSIPSSGWSET